MCTTWRIVSEKVRDLSAGICVAHITSGFAHIAFLDGRDLPDPATLSQTAAEMLMVPERSTE